MQRLVLVLVFVALGAGVVDAHGFHGAGPVHGGFAQSVHAFVHLAHDALPLLLLAAAGYCVWRAVVAPASSGRTGQP